MITQLCKVTFLQRSFREVFWAPYGKTLLELAKSRDLPLEGACDGTLACSTCHVILPKHIYDNLPPPTEDELDMLDLAHGLTETSRLGCQIITSKQINEVEITFPQ